MANYVLQYNSAVVIGPEGYIGKYRKIAQTPIDRAYFERGTELLVFETDGVRCGIIICFDIWFPNIVQTYVKQNIDILIHIAILVVNKRAIFLE